MDNKQKYVMNENEIKKFNKRVEQICNEQIINCEVKFPKMALGIIEGNVYMISAKD